MIVPAPASRAPCSAFRPTAPQPITSTLAPGSTLAFRTTAPTPVITPQPMMQARSNGISLGTGDRARLGHDRVLAHGSRSPSSGAPARRRGACASVPSSSMPLRLVARERLAQDRQVALAVEAVAAVRVPGADDVVARLHRGHGRARPPRPRPRPRGRARSAADRRASPGSPRGRCGTGRWRAPRPARRRAASGAISSVSRVSGSPTLLRTAARNFMRSLRGLGVEQGVRFRIRDRIVVEAGVACRCRSGRGRFAG